MLTLLYDTWGPFNSGAVIETLAIHLNSKNLTAAFSLHTVTFWCKDKWCSPDEACWEVDLNLIELTHVSSESNFTKEMFGVLVVNTCYSLLKIKMSKIY